MRWFVGCVLALGLGWGGYMASPYWALYELARAIERGSVPEVSARINLRALRVSLARQIGREIAATGGAASSAGVSEAQVADLAATVLADPALDPLMTPEGVIDLLRPRAEGSRPDIPPPPFAAGQPSVRRALDYLGASSWRGFRNVYFALPPQRPRGERYRLQMRLSRLSWRLVSLDLPHDLRRAIMTRIEQRAEPRPR